MSVVRDPGSANRRKQLTPRHGFQIGVAIVKNGGGFRVNGQLELYCGLEVA